MANVSAKLMVQPLPLRDEEAHWRSRPTQGCSVSFATVSFTGLQGQKCLWEGSQACRADDGLGYLHP